MKIAVLNNEGTLLKILSAAGHDAFPLSVKKLDTEWADMLIVDNDTFDASTQQIISNAKEKCAAILFITTHFPEPQIVDALAAGASDYLVKPIRRNELLTRVEVLLRRVYPSQFVSEKFGRYAFEIRTARVSLSGQFIELTRKEFDLALLLFNNLGKPLSRATLLDAVWSREVDIPSRTLDTHISRVRTKLQLRSESGFQLAPVYGYGYRLEQMAQATEMTQ